MTIRTPASGADDPNRSTTMSEITAAELVEMREAMKALAGTTATDLARIYGVGYRAWKRYEREERGMPPGMTEFMRFRLLCIQELRRLELSEREAMIVARALWDWEPDPGRNGAAPADVSQRLVEAFADEGSVPYRLVTMTPGAVWALHDALERVRELADEPTPKALKAVGLVTR